jgi:hypothetical protein
MAALVAALCVATLLWGEQIGINGGMGWDGESYVRWAGDFPRQMFTLGTTKFHAQRALPSAAVWGVMKLAGAKMTTANLVGAFRWLDAVLLVAAAGVWAHLAIRMQWRRATGWVGFVALFGCFANARHALYYPALTDTPAFLLGMVVTWAYLLRHPIALWTCGLVGALTWPALTPVVCALLLLPRLGEPLPPPETRWRWWLRGGSAALAIAATTVFVVLGIHYLAHPVQALGIPKFAQWVRRDWLPITLPLLVALLVASWYAAVHQPALWNLGALLRRQRWLHVALALAGIAAIVVASSLWGATVGTTGPGPTGAQFLCLQTLEALRGPLWGLVHHVVYFGPIVVVAALRWPSVCRIAASWGHGAALALIILVAFAAASESRQWIHLVPLLVAVTVAATDDAWTPRRALAFAALALAWSKLWLHIGYDKPGDWRVFPTQRYFMNLGPWASDTSWGIHLAAAVVTAGVLWLVLRRPRHESSGSETQTSSSPAPRSP